MFVHSLDTIHTALELAASGQSNQQIARALGLSRDTVRRWRGGDLPGSKPRMVPRITRSSGPDLEGLEAGAYAHLLGLYLGDGTVSELPRTCRLRNALDARYPPGSWRVPHGRCEDIKRIFCDHLDLLGIGWTRPNAVSIAVARRADVAALDRFVGPISPRTYQSSHRS
jgi:hypothetical protein